ncbi:MAG: EF-hand domain-containing protein [Proteobacteria bacterium]|nr:EF-hand domain-containing protein [Pseudomonadota bacterium]
MSRKLMFAILLALPMAGTALYAAAQDPASAPASGDAHFQHMLKKMDSNGDGRISLDEFLAAATKRFQSIDTQGKGSITAADIAASPQMQGRDQRMAQRELHHMGAPAGSDSVTMDQYLAAAKARFAKIDTNGDGFIDADEMAAHHRAAHANAE